MTDMSVSDYLGHRRSAKVPTEGNVRVGVMGNLNAGKQVCERLVRE